MAGPDLRPFSKFAEFVAVTRESHIGSDLAGNLKPYIPLRALKEHWTSANISSVLRAFPQRLQINVGLIKESYLRIFSTLVYTDPEAVRKLEEFFIRRDLSDKRLPWSSRPSEWPDTPLFNKFFNEIAESQWLFFPFCFRPGGLYNRLINDQCVLPIVFAQETIAQGTAASVRAFDIHPDYNDLAAKGHPVQRRFVFKIYHNQRHESSYENECRALRGLGSSPSPNVVKFYGSLQQHGSYALILEYADGGDLSQFFETIPPPETVEDVVMFWGSLFQVFAGLKRIHQQMHYEEEYFQGIHEDIRPENILLVKGLPGSPYKFTPKIADFGLYTRVKTVMGSAMGLDHYGNPQFSSPECSHHTESSHSETNMITTSADIFSIGAVISHAVAWLVGGPTEQERYFTARKAYHENETSLRRFKKSGYEGCFHDSIEPLPLVAEQHKKYVKRLQPSDDVTPEVLKWIEKDMLLRGAQDRLPARNILEKFEQFMDGRSAAPPLPTPTPATDATLQGPCRSEPPVSPPSTVDGVSPPAAAPSGVGSEVGPQLPPQFFVSFHGDDAATPAISPPLRLLLPNDPRSTRQSLELPPNGPRSTKPPSPDEISVSSPLHPQISISQILKFKSDIRNGQSADPETAQLIDSLKFNLRGRDQFFFIDDSTSMHAYREAIADGFQALAWIAKRLDPNRIELAFASNPRKIHDAFASRTTPLLRRVQRCQYMGDGHLMEYRLGELIDGKIIPRLPYRLLGRNINFRARKQVSLYVFTDGDWGHEANCGDACGVEGPIKRLIEKLKELHLHRTHVSLHFVMFGEKVNGRKHLERLDDFGQKDGWDIVDVKHIKSGVAGMIYGPITRSNDDAS